MTKGNQMELKLITMDDCELWDKLYESKAFATFCKRQLAEPDEVESCFPAFLETKGYRLEDEKRREMEESARNTKWW
jgi:hypothetical protein